MELSESVLLEIRELCEAAAEMREAANQLWWAHNPDADLEGEPPDLEEAQERHSEAFYRLQRAEEAFSWLQRAEYYMRKRIGER